MQRSVGYDLRLKRDRRVYSGTAPRDFDQSGVSAGIVLRFSKNTQARVALEHMRIQSTGAVSLDWHSDAMAIDVTHQLDPVTQLSMGFGFRRIDGLQAGAALNRRGGQLRFGISRDLPDGKVFARATVVQQSLGRRATLRFGLEKDAGHSGLSAWIGAPIPASQEQN